MQLSVLSLLSVALVFAQSTSAAYFDQYSGRDCTGDIVSTTTLTANQNQCYQQLGNTASFFVSTDAFPCIFTQFTDSDSPLGCNFGSVTGVLNNTANEVGCLNFYGTGNFISGVCGSAS